MGKLATQTSYRCDNCLTKFRQDEDLIPPNQMRELRTVLLTSPYDLETEKKESHLNKYEYEVTIKINMERYRGMNEYLHLEEAMLCPQCQQEVIKQVLKKE